MKTMISRVFSRKEAPPQPTQAPSFAMSSELSSSDIEHYYHRIILECLRRMLVPADSTELSTRRDGLGPNKLPSFAGYVRILKWDPVVMPVLLQNMPVIDARIRCMANASLILEHTHFSGLWFQATSSTEGSPKALLGLPFEMIHQPGTGRAAA